MKLALLASLFALTALLYASVGFGGGSTYTALLIASGVDYRVVPLVALACNILVVSGNSLRYFREKLIPWGKLWPLLMFSVPSAWLGGRLEISEALFIGLLWIALLISGTRLLLENSPDESLNTKLTPLWVSAMIGGGIGFYSGLVGIGGGIFLAPVLHFLRWGKSKMIAATCSLFILVNSISGLTGQWSKLSNTTCLGEALSYWPLLPAVLIGGFIGSYLGVFKFSQSLVKRLTGGLILLVAIRLAFRWFQLII